MRLLSRCVTLYTEMIHENTILHFKSGYENLLHIHSIEHPIVCQLGGNNLDRLSKCVKFCEEMGYDEINLNVGCPSQKVQDGSFGACLMKTPEIVTSITKTMGDHCKLPITVKCRLGVDEFDSYEFTKKFIEEVSKNGGVRHFIMHARKALLKGLNPAENRKVPPLKYEWVLQLKKDFPHLEFTINGGFKEIERIEDILKESNELKGCMIGRLSYDNPWIISDFDRLFYNKPNQRLNRREILKIYGEYGDFAMEKNKFIRSPTLTRPIINLFAGEQFNAKYRQFLGEVQNFKNNEKFSQTIQRCVEMFDEVNKEALDKRPI